MIIIITIIIEEWKKNSKKKKRKYAFKIQNAGVCNAGLIYICIGPGQEPDSSDGLAKLRPLGNQRLSIRNIMQQNYAAEARNYTAVAIAERSDLKAEAKTYGLLHLPAVRRQPKARRPDRLEFSVYQTRLSTRMQS